MQTERCKKEVDRVRGKIISALLIAVFFSSLVVNIGFTEDPEPTIKVVPDHVTGYLPGEYFTVSIIIEDAVKVFSWEIELSYGAYRNLLAPTSIKEGNFLKDGWPYTFFTQSDDAFNGILIAGATCLMAPQGVSADYGVLCTIDFYILEAGEGPLEFVSTALVGKGSDLYPIPHTAIGAYYTGPIADFAGVPTEQNSHNVRGWRPGDTRKFKSLATQLPYPGNDPLYVRGKYTSVHDSGKVVTLYSGQHLWTSQPRETEYYYVNEFTLFWQHWNTIGDEPWLDAVDGSYVEGTAHGQLIGLFGFEDIALNPGDIISSVTLQGYTQADSADMDIDVYYFTGTAFPWIDSLWGTGNWGWHETRWIDSVTSNIVPSLLTESGFNGFQVVLYAYFPVTYGRVDALRLKVEFTGVESTYGWRFIRPGETNPVVVATWDIFEFDAGTWVTTVETEYRYGYPDPALPMVLHTGETVQTFTWQVRA